MAGDRKRDSSRWCGASSAGHRRLHGKSVLRAVAQSSGKPKTKTLSTAAATHTHTHTYCKEVTKQPRESESRRSQRAKMTKQPSGCVSSNGSCVPELHPRSCPRHGPGAGVGVVVGSVLMALGDCLAASSLRQLTQPTMMT